MQDSIGIKLGKVETKVENLENDIADIRNVDLLEIKKDIREIRDTITGVKGSWKALLAVGSILSGILITFASKLFDFWAAKGSN